MKGELTGDEAESSTSHGKISGLIVQKPTSGTDVEGHERRPSGVSRGNRRIWGRSGFPAPVAVESRYR